MSRDSGSQPAGGLIIGGGIGGLCTALGLARHGHRAQVLERHPAFQEIGYGIQLAPNATRVLDDLGVLESLLRVAVRPSAIRLMDALSGEEITSVDLGQEFIDRYGHPYVVVHRSDLQSHLLGACAGQPLVEIATGRDVVSLDDLGDHVVATCADGEAYHADFAVAADGLWSRVRGGRQQDEIRCEGFVAYRGTIPTSQIEQSDALDAMVMWVGPGAHAVQYKVRAGSTYNQVAVFRSRRFDLGESDWGTPEELDAHYAGFCDPLKLAASQLSRRHRYPMLDRDPLTRWVENRVALLGDAAHPMLPVLAQGGCQAIEDAAALVLSVAGEPDVPAALKDYEERRAGQAGLVQTTARRFAEACHIGGIGVDLRNAVFSRHDPRDYRVFDWLYSPSVSLDPA